MSDGGLRTAVNDLRRLVDESGTSMTLSTNDGRRGVTITPRGEKGAPMGAAQRSEQLTLEVAPGHVVPDVASFKVTGALGSAQESLMGHRVTVTIADADGQVIAAGAGHVKGVGFKRHEATTRAPAYVERIHSIKLDS